MHEIKDLYLDSDNEENLLFLQSLHPTADYHAAARSIGGCAVYVR